MARPHNATAQMKVRLKEWERARLETEAKRNGHSLNAEIVMRLRRSLGEDDFKEIYERIARLERVFPVNGTENGASAAEH